MPASTTKNKSAPTKRKKFTDSIQFLGGFEKLTLNDGDLLVVTTDSFLDPRQRERVCNDISFALSGTTKNRILLLEGGLKLGVIEKGKIQKSIDLG